MQYTIYVFIDETTILMQNSWKITWLEWIRSIAFICSEMWSKFNLNSHFYRKYISWFLLKFKGTKALIYLTLKIYCSYIFKYRTIEGFKAILYPIFELWSYTACYYFLHYICIKSIKKMIIVYTRNASCLFHKNIFLFTYHKFPCIWVLLIFYAVKSFFNYVSLMRLCVPWNMNFALFNVRIAFNIYLTL